jgi:hypothetical protein
VGVVDMRVVSKRNADEIRSHPEQSEGSGGSNRLPDSSLRSE